jgi:hypothetical protein
MWASTSMRPIVKSGYRVSNHWVQQESPAEVNAALLGFLEA